jgi:hypothetical protein
VRKIQEEITTDNPVIGERGTAAWRRPGEAAVEVRAV